MSILATLSGIVPVLKLLVLADCQLLHVKKLNYQCTVSKFYKHVKSEFDSDSLNSPRDIGIAEILKNNIDKMECSAVSIYCSKLHMYLEIRGIDL
jgi:hypothetical protein